MTKIITEIDELKKIRSLFDLKSSKIAFVPTMGALHEGHLSLIDRAREFSDLIFVSIFVNPLQFSPTEDFEAYPRDLESDKKILASKCDYIFLPKREDILRDIEHIKASPDLANCLCGNSRPGHFDGVVTIVKKLFTLVRPHFAIFGEKDFQQLKIIKDMVLKEKLNIEIISSPTIREKDGLAKSSRNLYLSEVERKNASALYKELLILSEKRQDELESAIGQARKRLEDLGFKIDYLEARWDRIFIAAKLGTTRLIDNLSFRKTHFKNPYLGVNP